MLRAGDGHEVGLDGRYTLRHTDSVLHCLRLVAVLSGKQFARRWRACNKGSEEFLDVDEEEAWRTRNLRHLSDAHTLSGIADLSFEVAESHFSVSYPGTSNIVLTMSHLI
jgi:hypothetical protein